MFQLQSKAESKAKRLGWGARLEAAAQAGAGVEVRATVVCTGTLVVDLPRQCALDCFWVPVAVQLTYVLAVHVAYKLGIIAGEYSCKPAEGAQGKEIQA